MPKIFLCAHKFHIIKKDLTLLVQHSVLIRKFLILLGNLSFSLGELESKISCLKTLLGDYKIILESSQEVLDLYEKLNPFLFWLYKFKIMEMRGEILTLQRKIWGVSLELLSCEQNLIAQTTQLQIWTSHDYIQFFLGGFICWWVGGCFLNGLFLILTPPSAITIVLASIQDLAPSFVGPTPDIAQIWPLIVQAVSLGEPIPASVTVSFVHFLSSLPVITQQEFFANLQAESPVAFNSIIQAINMLVGG